LKSKKWFLFSIRRFSPTTINCSKIAAAEIKVSIAAALVFLIGVKIVNKK
jgi:hypothetical protein